jgi:hypothetical protein
MFRGGNNSSASNFSSRQNASSDTTGNTASPAALTPFQHHQELYSHKKILLSLKLQLFNAAAAETLASNNNNNDMTPPPPFSSVSATAKSGQSTAPPIFLNIIRWAVAKTMENSGFFFHFLKGFKHFYENFGFFPIFKRILSSFL